MLFLPEPPPCSQPGSAVPEGAALVPGCGGPRVSALLVADFSSLHPQKVPFPSDDAEPNAPTGQSSPAGSAARCVAPLPSKPRFFTRNFSGRGAHSEFSPWRETRRFLPGSVSVEATRLCSAKARLAAELTFHSSVWQMINWDYRPVELGLAKAVIYAGLSHPEHGGKGSETRRIPCSEGAKHHPPGWSRVGADGEKGDAPPPPCDSQFCWFSRQNAAAKQPQAGPRSPGAAVHG